MDQYIVKRKMRRESDSELGINNAQDSADANISVQDVHVLQLELNFLERNRSLNEDIDNKCEFTSTTATSIEINNNNK